MHRLLLLLVAVSSALALPSRSSSNTVVVAAHPHDTLTFDEFTAVFNKKYASAAETARRQAIYESNKQFVADFNSKRTEDVTFTVGINAFADLTAEEFAQLGKRDNSKNFEAAPLTTSDAPASMDWRTSGCTPPVQNQGQCGAVAAVVATEIVEAMECIEHKDSVHLSEQQLVDCVLQGCNGGFIDSCLDFCVSNGLATMQQYPNSGTVGTCKKVPGKVKCAHVYKIPSGNETALTDAIGTVGPAACAIDASRTSFQLYRSGVYNDPSCSSSELDHMVLNVGYGTTANQPYYILQNSWGTSWGMSGFILMARNAKNMCGIASDAFYVTVV